MRWAILSDVHGNLPALNAVMDRIDRDSATDGILFLGDVLGYGAYPNECMDILRDRASVWVAGNHDHGVLDRTNLRVFNEYAREAILWCREQLSADHRKFIEEVPLVHEADRFTCVHATPDSPLAWDYIFTIAEAQRAFGALENEVCFFGHSHVPIILEERPGGGIQVLHNTEMVLQPNHRYLINPGSVGQPRDGNPDAAFGTFDTETNTYRLVRVGYNIDDVAHAIIRAGLPAFLASRLYGGL